MGALDSARGSRYHLFVQEQGDMGDFIRLEIRMKLLFYALRGILSGLLVAAAGGALAASPPAVVVTIKPLHSLVSALMDGVGAPKLLIEGGGSPHGYVLRPSDARLLQQADLLIWVGASLETFLIRPVESLPRQIEVMSLAAALQSSLLPVRSGGGWEPHTHSGHNHSHAASAHTADHDPAHAEHNYTQLAVNYDPHLWLSPTVAQQIAAEVAIVLMRLDPPHAAEYQVNLERLQAQLLALIDEIDAQLRPVRHLPYLVFHDAYQYFERDFGLAPIGSVQIDPERTPSARRISVLRSQIRATAARAVFSEPQFEPRLIQTLIEGHSICIGSLDPVGHDLPVGKELYFTLLRRMATDLQATLKRCSSHPNHAMMSR